MLDKPTFNVAIPFEGITTIQMNRLMASILFEYLNYLPSEEYDHYGDSLGILVDCLRKCEGSYRNKNENLSFSIDTIGNMVCVLVNQQAVNMLAQVLRPGQTREIIALSKAVADPMKCMSLRMEKYGQHLHRKLS